MSSSKLQYYVSQQLSVHFSQYVIRENFRPDWLNTNNGGNLELDFFIEELNLAIEVQGQQHWMFVPFFHGDKEGYDRRIKYDNQKRNICKGRDIRLVEIFSESGMDDLIEELLISRHKEAERITERSKRETQARKEKVSREKNKLQRDLKKVDKGMYNILQRMKKCGPSELGNNENKLSYVANRRRNILQRLDEIGS